MPFETLEVGVERKMVDVVNPVITTSLRKEYLRKIIMEASKPQEWCSGQPYFQRHQTNHCIKRYSYTVNHNRESIDHYSWSNSKLILVNLSYINGWLGEKKRVAMFFIFFKCSWKPLFLKTNVSLQYIFYLRNQMMHINCISFWLQLLTQINDWPPVYKAMTGKARQFQHNNLKPHQAASESKICLYPKWLHTHPVNLVPNKAGEPNCAEYLLTSTVSGTIIDAESVIGWDALLCDVCANACVCACVCISQRLKGLQCHLDPEDISSNTSEMRGEVINKLEFIVYAWVGALGTVFSYFWANTAILPKWTVAYSFWWTQYRLFQQNISLYIHCSLGIKSLWWFPHRISSQTSHQVD